MSLHSFSWRGVKSREAGPQVTLCSCLPLSPCLTFSPFPLAERQGGRSTRTRPCGDSTLLRPRCAATPFSLPLSLRSSFPAPLSNPPLFTSGLHGLPPSFKPPPRAPCFSRAWRTMSESARPFEWCGYFPHRRSFKTKRSHRGVTRPIAPGFRSVCPLGSPSLETVSLRLVPAVALQFLRLHA